MSVIPKWPCAVPCCILREQWALEPRDPNRRTEMDDGQIDVRRRLSRIPMEIGGAWDLAAEQVSVFRAWWTSDLDAGSAWFTGLVFDGHCTTEQRLRFVGGSPPWRISSPQNGRFILTARLEVLDLPVLDTDVREAVEADILYEGGAAALDADIAAALAAIQVPGP